FSEEFPISLTSRAYTRLFLFLVLLKPGTTYCFGPGTDQVRLTASAKAPAVKKPDTTYKKERPMTSNGEYVTTDDGVRLFVQRMGDGPDALIIPNRVYMVDAFVRLAKRRTVLFCDPRNRGVSDRATEPAQVEKGIHHDVDDFDAIRRHYGIDHVSLLGHSYIATGVALYAMKYPQHTRRVVQIGPMGPEASRQYPADLSNADDTLNDVLARLG